MTRLPSFVGRGTDDRVPANTEHEHSPVYVRRKDTVRNTYTGEMNTFETVVSSSCSACGKGLCIWCGDEVPGPRRVKCHDCEDAY